MPGHFAHIRTVNLDGVQQITTSITKDAAEELGLGFGSPVTAMVKSTGAMIGATDRCTDPASQASGQDG